MPPVCDKFLDRAGRGRSCPRLPGPAGAPQPVVCGAKVKSNPSPLLYCHAWQNCWMGNPPCNL